MNNNEKSNVIPLGAWRHNKELEEELRQAEAIRPIEIPEHIAVAVDENRAREQRLGIHVLGRVIDKVPEATDSDITSTGPEFHYDE